MSHQVWICLLEPAEFQHFTSLMTRWIWLMDWLWYHRYTWLWLSLSSIIENCCPCLFFMTKHFWHQLWSYSWWKPPPWMDTSFLEHFQPATPVDTFLEIRTILPYSNSSKKDFSFEYYHAWSMVKCLNCLKSCSSSFWQLEHGLPGNEKPLTKALCTTVTPPTCNSVIKSRQRFHIQN